ncbi:hypothetical protein EV368DRAFT_86293 [Lentinula lateritia]|nr:hypothetical protein EV368DRAFT_86293 [Lentinula lateritia]
MELESSPVLRNALLRTMVVNLSGQAGKFSPCDLIQEFFNCLLEFMVERKGKEFDHVLIQQVIAQNLHHMAQTKPSMREGINLAKHSGKHSELHTRPEVKILLQQYTHHQLHSRCAGRFIEEWDVDNFEKGCNKLRKGKVAKWAEETTRAQVRDDVKRQISTLGMQDISNPSTRPTTSTAISDHSGGIDKQSDSESEEEDVNNDDSVDNEETFRNTMDVMIEEAMELLDKEFGKDSFDDMFGNQASDSSEDEENY